MCLFVSIHIRVYVYTTSLFRSFLVSFSMEHSHRSAASIAPARAQAFTMLAIAPECLDCAGELRSRWWMTNDSWEICNEEICKSSLTLSTTSFFTKGTANPLHQRRWLPGVTSKASGLHNHWIATTGFGLTSWNFQLLLSWDFCKWPPQEPKLKPIPPIRPSFIHLSAFCKSPRRTQPWIRMV